MYTLINNRSVYKRKLRGKRAVQLKDLPPTTDAAYQHLLRIYLQVLNNFESFIKFLNSVVIYAYRF